MGGFDDSIHFITCVKNGLIPDGSDVYSTADIDDIRQIHQI